MRLIRSICQLHLLTSQYHITWRTWNHLEHYQLRDLIARWLKPKLSTSILFQLHFRRIWIRFLKYEWLKHDRQHYIDQFDLWIILAIRIWQLHLFQHFFVLPPSIDVMVYRPSFMVRYYPNRPNCQCYQLNQLYCWLLLMCYDPK